VECCRLLLARGATVGLAAGTPPVTPLEAAAAAGALSALFFLLDRNATLTDAALVAAATTGAALAAGALLTAGLAPDVADESGRTPLHVAAAGGHLDVLRVLRRAGADVNQATVVVEHYEHETEVPGLVLDVRCKCRATLRGHAGMVHSVSFSEDGKRVVTRGEDRAPRLYQASNGAFVAALKGHTAAVISCRWSPDSQAVATASKDGSLRLWSADTGACIATLAGHVGAVRSCRWSPDGKTLASCGDDKTLRLWGTEGGVLASPVAAAVLRGHRGVRDAASIIDAACVC
jgi:hypothetical protein